MTRFLFYIVSLFLIAGGAQAQTKTTIQEVIARRKSSRRSD